MDQRFWYLLRRRSAMKQTDARVKAYVTAILKKNKGLTEREVKAAVRRGLKLGRTSIGSAVIRRIRRSLRIDRPRAIAYVRNLLAKHPTLEAKKVIEDVGARFGISLAAPDVSHLRPAGARRKRTSQGKVVAQPTRDSRRSRAKVETQPTRKTQGSSRAISATYNATGTSEEVARFFRSLAQ
jgi:hypothetical protein